MSDPATTASELTPRTLLEVLCRVLGVSFCASAVLNAVSYAAHGFPVSYVVDGLASAAAGVFLIWRADLVQRWCMRASPAKPAA
jgi:hypothetical protein